MITESVIDNLATAVAKVGFSRAARAALQEAFAGVRLTFCLLDEMEASEPFRAYPGFSLFLVGASDHCIGLTSMLERAVGVVIAEE